MTKCLLTSPTPSIARLMPFSPPREDRGKYIQFQRFALGSGTGPTAAPLAADANHTHGVENLYGKTQIVELRTPPACPE